jgi:hypothetical protein
MISCSKGGLPRPLEDYCPGLGRVAYIGSLSLLVLYTEQADDCGKAMQGMGRVGVGLD